MPLKCGSESTDYQWYQIHKIEDALATMRRYGIPEESPAYQTLWQQRGKLLGSVGSIHPKDTMLLYLMMPMSPGSLKVWFDTESGWMSEAREKPGAAPIYHLISDEEAMTILKGEVTKELETTLMTPDDYIGE